jgi:hypothetical protein
VKGILPIEVRESANTFPSPAVDVKSRGRGKFGIEGEVLGLSGNWLWEDDDWSAILNLLPNGGNDFEDQTART